jgi:hypothetical protein
MLTAGALCGVLVFFVALPLARSSPYPIPQEGAWVVQKGPVRVASLVPMPIVVGVRGDREDRLHKSEAKAGMQLASLGSVPISLPPVDADVTGSIPPAANADDVAPKIAPAMFTPPLPPRRAKPPKPRDPMAVVDDYLWKVYERSPIKKDSTGDFTWKDKAAAKHMGKSLRAYVIGGMDPDFREQLYHAGRAMDAAGLRWSMLSAFRDDYRQRIAEGFKARVGNSLHGGSRATGGYGHGRAVDVISADRHADEAVWHWLDKHGAKYGLLRPMPGADPAHIRPRENWHKIAIALRRARTGATEIAAAPAHNAKLAEQRAHRRRGRRI